MLSCMHTEECTPGAADRTKGFPLCLEDGPRSISGLQTSGAHHTNVAQHVVEGVICQPPVTFKHTNAFSHVR